MDCESEGIENYQHMTIDVNQMFVTKIEEMIIKSKKCQFLFNFKSF